MIEPTDELEKKRSRAVAIKNEGNVLVKQEKWADAISRYNQAIALDPNDPIFYSNRAFCQLKLDNLHSAISDCTKAIQLDEKQVKAYHRRAQARVELKKYPEAQKDVEKVLSIEPKNREAKVLLNEIKKKSGKFKSTMVEIETDPTTKIKDKTNLLTKVVETHTTITPMSLPPWLPPLKNGVTIVSPVATVPYKLKEEFKRIQVREIGTKESIFENTCKLPEKKISIVSESKIKSEESIPVSVITPETSVDFLQHWKRYPSLDHRYLYLKKIISDKIPSIFNNTMESDVLSQILKVLHEKFVPNDNKVFEYLRSLSKVKRFGTLVFFMTENDREMLKSLFDHCLNKEGRTDSEMNELSLAYNLK